MKRERSLKACAVIRAALSNDDAERILRSVGHEPQAIADAFAIGQACDLVAEAFEGAPGERAAFWRLKEENESLRAFIAASKECAEADSIVKVTDAYDDLRARVTAAMNALLEAPDATVTMGACPFCGESWPTVGCDRERRMAIAAEHDSQCAKNPIKIERDALRRAVIDLYHLQLHREDEAAEAWAIRQTANDLSAPYSDERVRARLAADRAKEPTP